MDLGRWFEAAADDLNARLAQTSLISGRDERAVHLAVLIEPYLSFVLNGTKTIESRFASMRIAPYRCVSSGDLVLLKQASGPVIAAADVGAVWFFRGHPRLETDLRARFGQRLRDDVPGFWDDRRNANYATLIQLDLVTPLLPPLGCPKTDRRGWVVLRDRSTQLGLFA